VSASFLIGFKSMLHLLKDGLAVPAKAALEALLSEAAASLATLRLLPATGDYFRRRSELVIIQHFLSLKLLLPQELLAWDNLLVLLQGCCARELTLEAELVHRVVWLLLIFNPARVCVVIRRVLVKLGD